MTQKQKKSRVEADFPRHASPESPRKTSSNKNIKIALKKNENFAKIFGFAWVLVFKKFS